MKLLLVLVAACVAIAQVQCEKPVDDGVNMMELYNTIAKGDDWHPQDEGEMMMMNARQAVEEEKEDERALNQFTNEDVTLFSDLYAQNIEKQKRMVESADTKPATVSVTRGLSHYLKASPSMIAKGRRAQAALDTVREFKRIWEEKRAEAFDPAAFAAKLQALEENPLALQLVEDIRNPRIIQLTLRGDEEFELEPFECLNITRDCSNVRDSRFRTFDGSCNNLVPGREGFGSIERAFKRRLPTRYGDGLFSPRTSLGFVQLPPARKMSQVLNALGEQNPERLGSPVNSLFMMQIGQFIDHDVTHSPAQGDNVECTCATPVNDVCFPYPVESTHSLSPCVPLKRTIPILNDQCDLTRFEQANSLSAWLDASMIYGQSVTNSTKLRDPRPTIAGQGDRTQGRMFTRRNPVSRNFRDQLLPPVPSCVRADNVCPSLTGDSRANEQVGLVSMHTVWVRLHNFFERNLARINPLWENERLFQETRRLIIAVWQNIVFNEYFQVILGPSAFRFFQLGRDQGGYNANLNPDIANEFAAACFRFGHTEIPETMPFVDSAFGGRVDTPLEEQFEADSATNIFTSPVPGTNGIDSLMNGMADSVSQLFDTSFSEVIRERLFVEEGNAQGFDLPAINIQRARDHGVAGYGEALRFCGLPVTDRFLRPETRDVLKAKYGVGLNETETLNNIDLFVGGSSEIPFPNGQLGPVFTCIVGKQFMEIKNGDRFYYGHEDAGFSARQIETIESYSLARAMCDANPQVTTIQPLALLQPFTTTPADSGLQILLGPNRDNSRVPCREIQGFQFGRFRDPAAQLPAALP